MTPLLPSFNPFDNVELLPGFPGRRAPGAFPALPQEDADPLLKRLGKHSLGAIGYIGSTLSKPHRALRGLISGDPREALSFLPFSDSLGITDPEQEHTTDSILQSHGIVGKNDPTAWELRDLLVPAVDIASDPATYVNPLALTKAGKLAKATGALKGGLGTQIREGNRALVGLGIPFREPTKWIGVGPKSAKVGDRLSQIGESVLSAPGVRQATALLNPDYGRTDVRFLQKAFSEVGVPTKNASLAKAKLAEHRIRTKVAKILRRSPVGAEMETMRAIRQANELGLGQGQQVVDDIATRGNRGILPTYADADALKDFVGKKYPAMENIGRKIASTEADWLKAEQELGLNTKALDDTIEYGHRRPISAPTKEAEKAYRLLSTMTGANIKRKKTWRAIPGGTAQIDGWAMDPMLSGPAAAEAAPSADRVARIAEDIAKKLPGIPASDPGVLSKARSISRALVKLPQEHSEFGIPLFHPDEAANLLSRGQQHASKLGAVATLYRGIQGTATNDATNAIPVREFARQLGLGTQRKWLDVPEHVAQHLEALGIPLETARKHAGHINAGGLDPIAASTVTQLSKVLTPEEIKGLISYNAVGSDVQLLKKLAKKDISTKVFTLGDNDYAKTIKRLDDFHIGNKDADAMGRFMRTWTAPTEMKKPIKYFDDLTNLFKSWLYPVWPAAHARNAVSIAWNNYIHGTTGSHYRDAISALRHGKIGELKPFLTGATPEAQAADLIRQAYARGVTSTPTSSFLGADVYGEGNNVLRNIANSGHGDRPELKFLPPVPGTELRSKTGKLLPDLKAFVRETIDNARKPGGLNPLAVAGVGGRTKDTNAIVHAGRAVGTNMEQVGRLANFLGNLEAGMTPDIAAATTKGIHFDYSHLTPFEKNVMRRLVPFYTYTRKNLPMQLRLIAQHPHQLTVLHKIQENAQRDAYVPEHLRGDIAIPLGREENGTATVLSGLGLPIEEALGRLRFLERQETIPGVNHVVRPYLPDVFGTLGRYIGTMNPLIKAPLEQVSDHSFHTGRRLSDMHASGLAGAYGHMDEDAAQLLTQVMANTPASRLISSINTLADNRKSVGAKLSNLLTGFKVSDIDTERLRGIETRKQIENMLKRYPDIRSSTDFYLPTERRSEVTPEEDLLLRLYSRSKLNAKTAAKERQHAVQD